MSAAPCERLAGVRARRRLLALTLLAGLSALLGGTARAAPAAYTPTLRALAARDILQLPMTTVRSLSDADKTALRLRLDEARAAQLRFETLVLPRATALAPRARAALPETAARVVALDLVRRRSGQPPIVYGLRRSDQLGLPPTLASLFQARVLKASPGPGPRPPLLLPDAYINLGDPIARLVAPVLVGNNSPAAVRVEVLPSVPFGMILDVDSRVIYLSAVLLELALADEATAAPPGRELSSRSDLGAPAGGEPGDDDEDDGGARRDGSDRSAGDEGGRGARRRDDRSAPCIVGTLCIACSRESCKDCGCQRELNSFCDRCDRWNRDCAQCNSGCTRCNEDCSSGCTKCNSDCTKSCTRCNSDCTKSCSSCNSGCSQCGNDCNRCSNDCNNCNSECSRCSSDCSRCGNECNSCNSECSRCNSDCSRCGGGCNQCQLARPLMPPPLPEPRGAALWARATRDSVLLVMPPLVFLFLRRRLQRRRAPSAAGTAEAAP